MQELRPTIVELAPACILATVTDQYGNLPNYVKAMQKIARKMVREGKSPTPGFVHHVDIYHNDDCASFSGGLCRCRVEVSMRDEHLSN